MYTPILHPSSFIDRHQLNVKVQVIAGLVEVVIEINGLEAIVGWFALIQIQVDAPSDLVAE
jgi:hypothetical protein